MKKVARNMNELNAMLLHEITKAMNITSEKVLAEMYGETYMFYTKGKPKVYKRTGALGDTPRTTSPTVVGHLVSFDAYLDLRHQYTTGKTPSMLDVLRLANSGITHSSVGCLKPTLGKNGFWEASEKKIERTLNTTMRKFFRKI